MRQTLLVLFAVITTGGCAGTGNYVHTPEEWLFHFKQGTFLRSTVMSEVNRPTRQVVADIAE